MWCVCYHCYVTHVELLLTFVLAVIVLTARRPDVSNAGITGQVGVTATLYSYSGGARFESPPGCRISLRLSWFFHIQPEKFVG